MLIVKALAFATEKHKGQTRRINGEDYIQHCIRVGDLVSKYTESHTLVSAAILHDTLEDTETHFDELDLKFGSKVAKLVLALTNNSEEMAKMGGKRNYLAAKINTLEPDALLIKLADRLDNISDLSEDAWSVKYCEETRHIFLETLKRENLATCGHVDLHEKIRTRVLKCEFICAQNQLK